MIYDERNQQQIIQISNKPGKISNDFFTSVLINIVNYHKLT